MRFVNRSEYKTRACVLQDLRPGKGYSASRIGEDLEKGGGRGLLRQSSIPAPTTDMSIPEAEDRNVYDTIVGLCILRDRHDPEETIAKKLKFADADAMRRQLRDWDLPDWLVGQVPDTDVTEQKVRIKSRSRPRTLGASRDLPAPSNAAPLFRERLEALLESVALLEHMDEDLRGKYFIRTDVDTTPVYFSRNHVSEEVWETISKQYDLDPDDTDFLITDSRNKFPGGIAKSPSESLATLIGVYALAGGDMDVLVAALQRDLPPPESEVWDEIELYVEGAKADNDKRDGLKVLASNLATWVRGSEVKPGRPSGLSKAEHGFACMITRDRERGLTDDEIARKESHRKKDDGSSYSVKDIAKLGALELRWS